MLTANQSRVSIHANDAYLIIIAYSRLNPPICLAPGSGSVLGREGLQPPNKQAPVMRSEVLLKTRQTPA